MPLAPLRPKFRLRTTLVVPLILQTVAAVGLISYLFFRNERNTVDSLATQLNNQVSNRVSQQLTSYLEIPRQVNEINLQAIELGILNPNDLNQTGRLFWKQMRLFKNLSYVNFGGEDGSFIGIGREDDGALYTERIQPADAFRYKRYALDEQGSPTQLLATEPYPFQGDEWYVSAVTAGKPVWSSIYQWVDRPDVISISSSYPVYDASNQLLGVLGVDFILTQISDFLRTLNISPSGKIFIIERDGTVVASSSQEKPYLDINGEAQRLNILQSQEPLMRDAARHLRDRFGSLDQIGTAHLLDMTLESGPSYVSVTPWQDDLGLNWLVVVVIPESDFIGEINANTRNTLGLCLAILGLAIASGILTARWINRQILGISQASAAMAQGNIDQYVASSNLVEIDRLATSFNRMAAEMQQSFDALRQSEARNHAILNAIPDLILCIHQDGRYLDVKPAKGVKMVTSHDNQIGKSVHEILPPDLAQTYLHHIHQALHSDQAQEFEYQLVIDDQPNDYEARVVKSSEEEALLIVRDITERKQNEAALIESEERFRGLVANIPGAIYRSRCDPDWTIEYISDVIATISGYPASDFIQNRVRTYTSIIHPDDRALVDVVVNHGIVIQEPYILDYRVLHRDGSIRWVYERGRGVFDTDGTPLYLDGVIFDVTERKQAEEALRQSEATNRALIDAIPDWLVRLRGDGTVIEDPMGTARLRGFLGSKTGLAGTSAYASLPPKQADQRREAIRRALDTNDLVVYEHQLMIDGELVDEEVRVIVMGEDEVLIMVRDITDRKRSEAALRQSEATNRALIESIPDLLLRVRGDGVYLDALLGPGRVRRFSTEPVIPYQTTVYDSLPPAQAQQRMEAIRRALETKTPQVYEQQLQSDGYPIDEEVRIVVMGEDEVLVMVRDITERKQAEAAMERQLAAIEATIIGVALLDNEGHLIHMNSAHARLYGYDNAAALLGHDWQSLYTPEERQRFEHEIMPRFFQEGYWHGEATGQRRDGTTFLKEVSLTLMKDGGIVCIIQDITERKQAEAALRQSEANNRALIEAIPDLLIRMKGDGTYLGIANSDRQSVLKAQESITGHASVYDLLPFEVAEQRMHYVREALQTGELQFYEQQLVIDGQREFEEVRIAVTGTDEVLAIVRNITERKRSEEALRIAEENYRSIFENALEGIFQSSPEGRFINANPALARIYGYDSPAEMIDSITNIGEQLYVDSDKRTDFKELLTKEDTTKGFEYQCYRKDGSIIWIQIDARAVKDNSGNVLYFEGIVQDVSDRKRREDELKRQLEELKIEIDQKKRARQVAEITQTDYFQQLLQEADALRFSDDISQS